MPELRVPRVVSRAVVTLIAISALTLVAGRIVIRGGDDSGTPAPGATLRGVVTRAIDGDTVVVRLADGPQDVRYIGVDTPESVEPGTPVQCYALAASHFNEGLVEGRRVRLVVGEQPRDAYGRLLAYVYAGSTLVNEQLLSGGYATALTIPPNDRFARRFKRLERRAARAGRGLWGEC